MKGKIAIAVLILMLMLSSTFASAMNVNEDNGYGIGILEDAIVYIYVDYVTNDYDLGLDELDWWPSEEPEWGYRITVFDDSGNSGTIENWHDQSVYTWNVGETHEFSGYTHNAWVHIQIELLDDDGILPDEQADISARTESGGEQKKTFMANWDLETDELSHPEEQWEDQGNNYYLLTGDLDGTAGHNNDDNDANMRIQVSDNYEPLDVTLTIDEYLENNNVPPGQEITFKATVSGGLAPFEYMLYPYGYGEYETKISDDRIVEFKYSYKTGDHGRYKPLMAVYDSQNCGGSDEITITVNNRPDKPGKPTVKRLLGQYRYEVSATDPDGDNLQYKWEFDGVEEDWDLMHTVYKDKKAKKVRVKVRDDPNWDGTYGDGLETDWSEPLPRSIPRTYPLITRLLQKFPVFAQLLQHFLIYA